MTPTDALHFRRLEPHIVAALQYAEGTHTVADVEQLVSDGSMQLWPGVDSIVLTRIVSTPQKKHCTMFLAAGHLGELEVLHPIVEEFARSEGCNAMTLIGRRGWERSFLTQRCGWKAPLIYLSKQLGYA